jgi:hypothetical protein
VPETCPKEDPSAELGTNGPDVGACVRDAVDALSTRPSRDPASGRFVAGNVDALKTGWTSDALWKALAGVKRDLLASVREDHGGTDDAPTTLLALQEAWVEASLFRRSMFVRMTEGQNPGPITAKGRTKALYAAWCAALDREMKLAQVLGLTRRAKKVANPLDFIEGLI